MAAHSTLGASGAWRWWNCPGSVAAIATVPPVSSFFAKQGNAAHDLAEACLKGGHDAVEFIDRVFHVEGDDFIVDDDMADAVQTYLDYIRELMQPGDILIVEHRFDLSRLHPKFFGTGDVVIYRPSTGWLFIVDYKHGRGVPVEVEENEQLMYYGLGGLLTLGHVVKGVSLVVVQPRRHHRDGPVRSWDIEPFTLLEWASDLLAAAYRTEVKDAPRVAGDWCEFCDFAGPCPERRAKSLEIARAEFTDSEIVYLPAPDEYNLETTARILQEVDQVEDWCAAFRQWAHTQAVNGWVPPGYKLVPTRPFRRFRDVTQAVEVMEMLGFTADQLHHEPKLKSPAQMEKLLGKKHKKTLDKYITNASKGTVLAPLNDERESAVSDPALEFDAVEEYGD